MYSFAEFQYKNKPSYISINSPSHGKHVKPPVPKLAFENLKCDENQPVNSARVYGPKAPAGPNPRFSHASSHSEKARHVTNHPKRTNFT